MNNVLVTGANRGIGLALCKQLTARGDQVIAVCRHSSDALAVLDLEIIDGVDVSSADGVLRLVNCLGNRKLDWLINNAGILSADSLESLDFESIERQFSVNALGPLRVSRALLDNLCSGSKVGIVTSRMGSIEDNTSGGYYGYRMSKAAVNMAGMSLSRDLAGRGISVVLLHPGMVATAMTGRRGIPVAQAAAGIIARMDELDLSATGTFWHVEGERLPW